MIPHSIQSPVGNVYNRRAVALHEKRFQLPSNNPRSFEILHQREAVNLVREAVPVPLA